MAGFGVVGVDHKRQPRYCGEHFVQGDATSPPFDLSGFDFIWASPPCQASSTLKQLPWLAGKEYPQLIPQTRDLLIGSGKPWVIENVPRAPLRADLTLCGTQFGLPCYRHRIFEISGFWLLGMPHDRHFEKIGNSPHHPDRPFRRQNGRPIGTLNANSARGSWGKGGFVTVAGHQFKKHDGQIALGIDWMTRDEMAQAIPPAYAEYIGSAVLRYLS